MSNITVTIDDQVYERVKLRAAELNTSVSALVEAFLIQLVEDAADSERRKALLRTTLASIHAFSAGDRLGREQVHERSQEPQPPAGQRKSPAARSGVAFTGRKSFTG